MRRKVFWVIGLLFVINGGGMFSPREAQAIPAWGRKYEVPCSVCHYPAVPRLNATGWRFRWAGHRMPHEIGVEQDISNVGNFLAARGRGRYLYVNPDEGPRESEFQWHDATLFYAGPVTKHFSAFNEVELEPEEERTEIALVAQIQGVWGRPEHFSTVRLGQFHSLKRVGIGAFDRPLGISSPSIFSERLTASEIPFRIDLDQRGVEVAHVLRNSRLLAQVLNGFGVGVGSGTEGEEDQEKDLLIAFEQILDELASGFTLYGYRGGWHDGVVPDASRFYRYGAAANKVFPFGFGVMGGYVGSIDNQPALIGPTIRGDAFFVELEQYLKGSDLTLFARYDWIDPDRNADGETRNRQTAGAVQTLQRNLRLALEGRRLHDRRADLTDYRLAAEAMINF